MNPAKFFLLSAALLQAVFPASAQTAFMDAANMSLEEKVGQVMICSFRGPVLSPVLKRLIEDLKIGGVVLYSSWGNIASPGQIKDLCNDIQSLARSSGVNPLFIAVDQEGGIVSRIREGVTNFPGNMALGAAGDEALAAEAASACARELFALGINMNFAPVADVNNNPLNPVIGVRSYGSSAALVSKLAAAAAAASFREGVIPAGKHFPGHGNTETDSHSGLPAVPSDRDALEAVELLPFRALISAGIPAIMTGHVVVPAVDGERPATLSPAVMGLLRKEMGFSGVIISDSMGMGALKAFGSVAEAAVEAFRSGVDILLFGADKGFTEAEQFVIYEELLRACRNGVISEERLDGAVGRILALKRIAQESFSGREKPAPSLPFKEDPSAAKIASKSITLVRPWEEGAAAVKKGNPVPLLWPENKLEAGRRLAASCPIFTLYAVSGKPSPEEIFGLAGRLQAEPVIFAAEYDCWKDKGWLALLRELGEERLFILSARTPYSLLSLPRCGGFFALYSDEAATLDALSEIFNGRAGPEGRLPVDLPGLYPRGWGEKLF